MGKNFGMSICLKEKPAEFGNAEALGSRFRQCHRVLFPRKEGGSVCYLYWRIFMAKVVHEATIETDFQAKCSLTCCCTAEEKRVVLDAIYIEGLLGHRWFMKLLYKRISRRNAV
ncbi:hypothetical protein M5689_019792 [Euphorbia peplus]|nr:hypothetical protein M5689_019792 [Euphorbia peplus]